MLIRVLRTVSTYQNFTLDIPTFILKMREQFTENNLHCKGLFCSINIGLYKYIIMGCFIKTELQETKLNSTIGFLRCSNLNAQLNEKTYFS